MTNTKPEVDRVGEQTDTLGESPVWCPIQQALYWVDIRAARRAPVRLRVRPHRHLDDAGPRRLAGGRR